VKLAASHHFAGSIAEVCAAMGDPAFYAALRLPDVEPPELVSRTADGMRVDVSVRFTYTGKLDPIARRIVGHDQVSWVQQLQIDPVAASAALQVVPAVGMVPVTCTGTFTLTAEGDGCVRSLDGDLRIKVPIIGSRAEKSLAPGILRRLDIEADALDAFLTT
jgi:Protein of unknown function (DUF2505)